MYTLSLLEFMATYVGVKHPTPWTTDTWFWIYRGEGGRKKKEEVKEKGGQRGGRERLLLLLFN